MLKQFGVGIFPTYEKTHTALVDLKENGFLMDMVFVVGRDIKNQTDTTGANTSNRLVDFGNLDTNENQAGEKAVDGAMAGITLGGFTGLLIGLGAIAIPGVGPIVLAGAAATALVSTISGGAIGGVAGGLAGGLIGLGIRQIELKSIAIALPKVSISLWLKATRLICLSLSQFSANIKLMIGIFMILLRTIPQKF
jgi:hypothetical protein